MTQKLARQLSFLGGIIGMTIKALRNSLFLRSLRPTWSTDPGGRGTTAWNKDPGSRGTYCPEHRIWKSRDLLPGTQTLKVEVSTVWNTNPGGRGTYCLEHRPRSSRYLLPGTLTLEITVPTTWNTNAGGRGTYYLEKRPWRSSYLLPGYWETWSLLRPQESRNFDIDRHPTSILG